MSFQVCTQRPPHVHGMKTRSEVLLNLSTCRISACNLFHWSCYHHLTRGCLICCTIIHEGLKIECSSLTVPLLPCLAAWRKGHLYRLNHRRAGVWRPTSKAPTTKARSNTKSKAYHHQISDIQSFKWNGMKNAKCFQSTSSGHCFPWHGLSLLRSEKATKSTLT